MLVMKWETMDRVGRIKKLIQEIPKLGEYRLELVSKIVEVLNMKIDIHTLPTSDIMNKSVSSDFGDILRLHHCFSREPFSKDKFEYALERVLEVNGISASLAKRGQRGYDMILVKEKISLKTEAARDIKVESIHISKFMELGGGDWGDKEEDLIGLRTQFLNTLVTFDKIIMLRALQKGNPYYVYELVEIPHSLLAEAEYGRLEMRMNSSQYPKPGYCFVEESGKLKFALYFDGGGERKLQIKNLDKQLCTVHATWRFMSPKRI